MKYNDSAEHNKASKVTPLCLKVSAGALCPGWGTTLPEGCGPTGNSPGNSDERTQKHNLCGKAERTEVVQNKDRTKRRCYNINADMYMAAAKRKEINSALCWVWTGQEKWAVVEDCRWMQPWLSGGVMG